MTMTIDEIRAANAAAGFHFFEPATLRFFSSRVGRTVYSGTRGAYFVTSERDTVGGYPRRYTVRRADETGRVETVGEFQGYATCAAAKRAAARIAARDAHPAFG